MEERTHKRKTQPHGKEMHRREVLTYGVHTWRRVQMEESTHEREYIRDESTHGGVYNIRERLKHKGG